MAQKVEITYYYHSGFSASVGDTLLVFDYWLGEHQELPEEARLTVEKLAAYRNVFVFISHAHPDHMDPVVFEWYKQTPVTYIVSSDTPVGTRGKRMKPGDELRLSDNAEVQAFDSTDLGVSFLVHIDGINIFHAGDLNFWHWREESTLREIEAAEEAFLNAMTPIQGNPIDLAMFPVDPRMGSLFDAGANHFIMAAKPRVLIPMHWWDRSDVAIGFARRAKTRATEVVALTEPGEVATFDFSDGRVEIDAKPKRMVGGNTQSFRPISEPETARTRQVRRVSMNVQASQGDDPFRDTEYPVDLPKDE